MSFNLVDLIKNELGDVVLDQVSSLLGETKGNTGNALNGTISGILENILSSSSESGSATKLASTLDGLDDSLVENFSSILTGGNHSSLVETGTKLLGSLLGNFSVSKMATTIANCSGIKNQSASSLIGLIAPVILGVIRKKMRSDNLDANGLLSMLQDQKDNISEAMPAGMVGSFDSKPDQAARTETSRGPRYGKLLWIPLFLLVGLFGYFYLPALLPHDSELDSPQTADGEPSAFEKAAENIKQTLVTSVTDESNESSDYVNIGSDLGSIINSVTDSLATVTDTETASAALPAISEASSKLEGLSELLNKLPAPAKSAITNIAANKVTSLQLFIDRTLEIPGVGPILKPAIDSLMQRLTAFTAT